MDRGYICFTQKKNNFVFGHEKSVIFLLLYFFLETAWSDYLYIFKIQVKIFFLYAYHSLLNKEWVHILALAGEASDLRIAYAPINCRIES